MLGYWNRDDETAKVMTQDGFFKTGDIGIRTESGAIKIVDRLKDMIIVSGFNVYPNEVEDVLTTHPSVMEAAVVGKPDEKTGERVCAFITVSSDVSTQDVIDFCKQHPQITRFLSRSRYLTSYQNLPSEKFYVESFVRLNDSPTCAAHSARCLIPSFTRFPLKNQVIATKG